VSGSGDAGSPGVTAQRRRRDLDGVLLIDKPAGGSSNAVLQRVRYLLNARKAGHGGTLDPLATGLLVVCFGEATKFSAQLLESGKTYTGEIHLGTRTDTGDAEGVVIQTAALPAGPIDLTALADRFTGPIIQQPPIYSALKHQGRPLYEYARAGTPVEARPREITIHRLVLTAPSVDRLAFEVTCSSGTYVRSLAEDLSSAMGTVGHLRVLRRTASGGYRVEDAVAPDALESLDMRRREERLLPTDALLREVPAWQMDASTAASILQGRSVAATPGIPIGRLRLYGPDQVFLGLGEADDAGTVRPLRLLATGLLHAAPDVA